MHLYQKDGVKLHSPSPRLHAGQDPEANRVARSHNEDTTFPESQARRTPRPDPLQRLLHCPAHTFNDRLLLSIRPGREEMVDSRGAEGKTGGAKFLQAWFASQDCNPYRVT